MPGDKVEKFCTVLSTVTYDEGRNFEAFCICENLSMSTLNRSSFNSF